MHVSVQWWSPAVFSCIQLESIQWSVAVSCDQLNQGRLAQLMDSAITLDIVQANLTHKWTLTPKLTQIAPHNDLSDLGALSLVRSPPPLIVFMFLQIKL